MPASLAIDKAGNLYISDTEYNVIRKVDTATGIITTIAGTTVAGYSGDGGQATAAQIGQVWGLATDPAGILYLADSTYNVVRQIVPSTGVITTIAGNGAAAYSGDGGSATSASLNSPTLLTVDTYGNLYVVDQTNSVIREIGPSGVLSFGSVSVASDSSPSPVTLENRGVSPVQLQSKLHRRLQRRSREHLRHGQLHAGGWCHLHDSSCLHSHRTRGSHGHLDSYRQRDVHKPRG